MDIAITGANGLIGHALSTALRAQGHRPVALVRRPARGVDEISWDPAAGTLDAGSLEGIGAVVHLAGAGIGDQRWTPAYKDLVRTSREGPTALLARTLAGLQRPPSTLVSASAIGIYGDRGDDVLDESSAAGEGFLAEVCKAWEGATVPAAEAGVRTVVIRTGIVLSPTGGALKKQLPLFRFGLGGKFGAGRQWQSWISIDDEVGAITHLLSASTLAGPVNLTAPNPVTNAEFTRALGKALGRPAPFTIPRFAPSIVLGKELVADLLFASQRVLPSRLVADGFTFAQPDLAGALTTLLGRR